MDAMSQIELYTTAGGRKVVSEGGYADILTVESPSRCKASKGFPPSLQSWIADLPAADDPGKKKKQIDCILQVRKCLNCGFPAAG